MTPTPSFERGVLHLDGAPVYFLSGDYPYYRDRRANWAARLRAIRGAGIDIVTTYVPWRHHAPEDPLHGHAAYDFEGKTQPNRDVRGFLRLCQEAGLLVVAKPGPFVHAELRYGGLPDYVDPERNDRIEPELKGDGTPWRWMTSGHGLTQSRALPAPLDPTFLRYVRDWFDRVTREVLAPFAAPDGPLIGVQILNEGIYSDSASGLIPNYGYSESSRAAWWRFLERKYGSLARYNELHGTSHAAWRDAEAPARVDAPQDLRHLLTHLDRSEFSHALYEEVIRTYVAFLREGGLDARLPILVNFCPNSNTYRTHVGSNDGWYSKVAWHPRMGVQWGYTNWLGVVEHQPRAFLQYVLAGSRERGPNVEEDWGFSGLYDPAYAHTQPSYFQSLLFLAAGATGFNAYTLVGTTAWSADSNLRVDELLGTEALRPAEATMDYPGHSPIASDGRLLPKYWTLAQVAHHLRAEGASLVGARRADIAWGVYPPYAWAGAWAPGGDAEEAPWLAAGLRAMPRVTYHGLEAFLEDGLAIDADVAQVNVLDASGADLARHKLIVLAGYDYMDTATQERLAAYVEGGGALLLTGLLPRLDGHLRPMHDAPLRTRVFDHADERMIRLPPDSIAPVGLVEGDASVERVGAASEWVTRVLAPPDARARFRVDGVGDVGYAVARGRGIGIYVGHHPWFAALNGDDLRLVAGNRGFVERVAERLTSARVAYARAEGTARRGSDASGEVNVWQYGAFLPRRNHLAAGEPDVDVEHLAVVSRAAMPHLAELRFTRFDGTVTRFRIALAPQTVCLVTFERGKARSMLLKCVNDHDAVAIPPTLEEPGGVWTADAPCDLCVTRTGASLVEVLLAESTRPMVHLRLPLPPARVERIEDGYGAPVAFQPTSGGIAFLASDQKDTGVYKIRLRDG